MCGEAQGAKEDGNDANYSGTGYLNKKFFHPAFQNGLNATTKYPYPLIRMAELYLNYAEILIELGGEDNLSKAKVYIDKIRTRAGIPTIDVAWKRPSIRRKPIHKTGYGKLYVVNVRLSSTSRIIASGIYAVGNKLKY